MADPALTKKQAWVVSHLPASAPEIAEKTTVGPSAIRDRINRINDKWDHDVIEYDAQAHEYVWAGKSETKRNLSSHHKGTITRKANEWLSEEEDRLRHELKKIDIPDKPPNPTDGNEDAVLALSDLHFGDTVEGLDDSLKHDSDILEIQVDHLFDKAIELLGIQMKGGVSFDTLHVVVNGDIVTNENIYESHFEVLDEYLNGQLARAVDTLERNLLKVSGMFDRVQVVFQVGNHGQDRASGSTREANADLHVFRELSKRFDTRKGELRTMLDSAPADADTEWIEDRIDCYESFAFEFNNAKYATKFKLRGGRWEGLVSHGQHFKDQLTGTASANEDKLAMLVDEETAHDIGYFAHYHELREDYKYGVPWIRTPSPKPSDDWAKLQAGAAQAPGTPNRIGFLHGVSDTRPKTWSYPIDDHGAEI